MKTFPVVLLLSTLCFFLILSSAHADIEWDTGDIDAPAVLLQSELEFRPV